MSVNRRNLVSRSRNEVSSPTQSSRSRNSAAPSTTARPLPPPYESPTCPLSVDAKRKLDVLRESHSYDKYKKHLKTSIVNVTNGTADCNDRLANRKIGVKRAAERRRTHGVDDTDKPDGDIEAERYADMLEKRVADLTSKAEKAMRDLIDYGDEVAMQESILKAMADNISSDPTVQLPARRRILEVDDEDSEGLDEGEHSVPASSPNVLSVVELLKEAKGDYAAKYTANSMRARYADNNDYKTFKSTVHDAQNPGDDAPPCPHSRYWFPEENEASTRGSRPIIDNEEDDDEVVIASVSRDLKCPLTLQYFDEPVTNDKCNHSFEKYAIEDYARTEATQYQPPARPGQRRPPAQGPKQFKCPQAGCERMLQLEDFHEDQLLLRQVKRAQKKVVHDEDEESLPLGSPPGTRPDQPQDLDDDDDVQPNYRRVAIAKTKREGARRQGIGSRSQPLSNQLNDGEAEEEDSVMQMD